MYFEGDISKSSKLELLHLKETPYWHKAGSGIQETFNRMSSSGIKELDQMDTATIEVWTTTMLALAMQHTEKKVFWLGRPKNDPPDMAVMTITEKGYFHARELEVTRCMHAGEELAANIVKKDQENKLSDKYILCGFVETPGVYDLMGIGRKLHTNLARTKNVVVVFHGINIAHPNEIVERTQMKNLWTVAQIVPTFDTITLNVSSEYKKWLYDPDKLRYTKNGKIYAGKKSPDEPYPTLLSDTPISP